MSAWPPSIPTIGSGGFATSAQFNAYRDALLALGNAWNIYVPLWNATTSNPTLGASTVAGRYIQTGQTWDIHITIVLGAGFTQGTGGYTFSFPPGFAPLLTTASGYLGAANGKDLSGGTSRGFHAYYLSSTAFALFKPDDGAVVGATAPWTWATGDTLDIHLSRVESA